MSRFERKGGKDPSQTSKLQYSIEKSEEEQKRLIESMARSKKTFEEMEERNPGRVEKYKEYVESRKNEIETLTAELEQLSNDLIVNINQDLGVLSNSDILKKYKKEIDLIEAKDDRRLEVLREKNPNATFTYYSRIFHILCNKDIDFLYRMPAKAFKGYVSGLKNEKLPIDKLTANDLIGLEKHLFNLDRTVFKDETFRRFYLKYFPTFIDQLETVEEVRTCLGLYPFQFQKMNTKVAGEMQALGEMLKLVTRAPKVLQYMTFEEREKFATDYPKGLGTALIREPDMLDVLDEKFFNRHNARLVFTNYPKSKLRQAFGNKILRHPNLETHIIQNNYHKPDPVLKNWSPQV